MEVPTAKTRRVHHDAAFKRKVIVCAESDGNRAASRAFSVPETCVRDWRKQKEKIFASKATRKGFSGPKKGRYPKIEDPLAEYVQQQRAAQKPVTTELLKIRAMQLALGQGLTRVEFKASRCWITNFMKRKGFSLRRRTGICQKLPAEYEEKLDAFQRYVLNLRRNNNYQLGQIGNADQTPLYFDMPATTTVEKKGTKQVRVLSSGHEKTRVTAMLCCTADGHKLPPYLIFKRKTLPKGIVFPSGVIIRANEKGWMTTDLVADWIDHVWRKRPGASLGLRAMLVLDAFRCHLDERIKDKLHACNTDLVVIPGGMTSQLQPLDVSLNKPVKDRIRALYTEWLVGDGHELTPTNRIKRASLQDFAGWAKDAWCTIPPTMVSKAFKKCGISNAMDGTEDDMLWAVESDKESSDSDDE